MLPNHKEVGRCSICGGIVSVYNGAWYGTIPPTPECESCGAVKTPDYHHLPIIPMTPRRITNTTSMFIDGKWIHKQENIDQYFESENKES